MPKKLTKKVSTKSTKKVTKSPTKKASKTSTRKLSAEDTDAAPNEIIIYNDGTWTPSGGVEINPGGVVKFDFDSSVPAGSCAVITFESIEITPPGPMFAGGGTIKVGS